MHNFILNMHGNNKESFFLLPVHAHRCVQKYLYYCISRVGFISNSSILDYFNRMKSTKLLTLTYSIAKYS